MANGAATPPRRSGLVQTRSGDARRKLIEAAARELWNEGSFEDAFEATTVADIARAAGMSKVPFTSTSPASKRFCSRWLGPQRGRWWRSS